MEILNDCPWCVRLLRLRDHRNHFDVLGRKSDGPNPMTPHHIEILADEVWRSISRLQEVKQ